MHKLSHNTILSQSKTTQEWPWYFLFTPILVWEILVLTMVLKIELDQPVWWADPIGHGSNSVRSIGLEVHWIGVGPLELTVQLVNWMNRSVQLKLLLFFKTVSKQRHFGWYIRKIAVAAGQSLCLSLMHHNPRHPELPSAAVTNRQSSLLSPLPNFPPRCWKPAKLPTAVNYPSLPLEPLLVVEAIFNFSFLCGTLHTCYMRLLIISLFILLENWKPNSIWREI